MIDAMRIICPWICCITLWMNEPTVFSACFWSISFAKAYYIRAWLINCRINFCYSPTQKSFFEGKLSISTKIQIFKMFFLHTIKVNGAVLWWSFDCRERVCKKIPEISLNLYLINYTLESIYVSAYNFWPPASAFLSFHDHQHSNVNLC